MSNTKKKAPVKKTPAPAKQKSGLNTTWLVIITVIVCVGFSILISNANKPIDFEFNNINVAKFTELYKGTEPAIVYIGRPTCSYCEKYNPILKKVAKENDLEVNYLNLDTFAEKDYNDFVEIDAYLKTQWGTPLVIVVGNNKIEEAKINGYVEEAATIDYLKSTGFIK